MAYRFDMASTGNANTDGNTLSWNHVLGNLTSPMIVVGVLGKDVSSTSDPVPTGVTFNGISMTELTSDANDGGGAKIACKLYALWGSQVPAAGTYTVAVTFAGNCYSRSAGAMSFDGLKQQTAEAIAHTSGSVTDTTPLQQSITTLTANALLVAVYGNQNVGFTGWGASNEIAAFDSHPSSAEQSQCVGGYRAVASPGSTTTIANVSNPESEALLMASFAIAPDQGGDYAYFI